MSEPPPAHTPSFRGRGRGRGRSQAVRAHVARLAQARKAANGRRGRQKLYDHPKPQAASERLKELKAAFSAVANAMRPALEDLADRSLDQLKSSPEAYRAFDQYQEIKSFLDGRYREVLEMHNNQRELDTQLNEYIFQESRAITEEGFIRDIEDAKDRFYDAQLQRLEILDKLHDNELPIDIIDDSWNFHELSDERFRDVKAHVEYRTTPNGHRVEVPCAKTVTGRRIAGTPTASSSGAGAGDDNALKPSPKRKADDDADALPPPKRLGAAPRHIGGLLSAVVAPTDEDEDDDAEARGSPGRDSKLPSPSPALAEEEDELLDDDENGTPLDDDDESNTHLRPSERLPPLPNGASEPDAFGVRLINKRRTANFDVYNRILVPTLFDFEPHEIGFRDSTNDKSRGATKIKRGRFLDTPNSNTMHFDRSLWQYDATTYEEGELDEELIKKHNLHPKYGLVLRTSTNEEEPPKERVSGKHPVVFYTPRGRTLNSSRSIRIARLEDGAEIASKRSAMTAAFDRFAEQEGLALNDIRPAEGELETFREEKMKLWLGPRRVTRDETEEVEERIEEMADNDYAMEEDEDRKVIVHPPRTPDRSRYAEDTAAAASVEDEDQAAANAMAAKAVFGTLLDAAAAVDTDGADAGARPHSSDDIVSQVSQASPPAPRRAASRPFDPVRDVFMDQPSAATNDDSASVGRHGSTDYVPQASSARSSQAYADVDTSNLLYMATLALDQESEPSYHQQQQPPPPPAPHMQYPPARGPAPYNYPPADLGPNNGYPPPPPRRMSMDPSQPYHSHQPPPPQHATPPQQPQNLIDPRLFNGDAPQSQQQLPPLPPSSSRDANNGYTGGSYYQQQPPPPPSSAYMHPNHHQGGPSYPPPGPSADPYGPPPPPSAAYGPPPSRGGSQYYMSPPPPTQQQPPPPQSQSHSMMRPYDTRYGPPLTEHEGALPPPPPSSSYGQPGLPPLMQSGPSHGNPPSPQQMYAAQPPPPPSYSRGGSREYQPHPHHEYAGSVENGPSNGDYPPGPESNGSNGNNKYRKLEPAPMTASKSNEWPSGGEYDRDHNRDSVTSSNGHASDGRPLAAGSEEPAPGFAAPSVGKEFRTVPYDYEKIKDYAAIEPPPSQGPKAIRGWAHNSLKRGGGGTTTTVSKAMSSTVSAIPPIKSEAPQSEWEADDKQMQQQQPPPPPPQQ